jgi:hypothetical protein
MFVQDIIKLVAGFFIIASVLLGYLVHEYFFFFTLFVGLNLLQSSITKWCLLEKILKGLGAKEGGGSCAL